MPGSRAPRPTSSSSPGSGATKALADSDLQTRLVLQIHDELLFEGPLKEMEAAGELVEVAMCDAFELETPLAVDIGIAKNWLAAK